ncbi:hypothetical protein C1645_815252 [Glomus cerebriforme]|uniref:Uncharacterized protein n=1 Tax=Glomus cerebriforme TaxID=658196 RepID=A0A397TJA7_9GLOM|nr:hypothetical protein C1645_815252 [Glomus cerebriforme]
MSNDKNDNDSDLDKKEETIATFSQKAIVKEVIYSTIPIEYPKTSEFGIAIIQYSLGGGGQNSIKNYPFFGNIGVKKKEKRTYMGIKHYEYVNAEAESLELANLEK